MDIASSRGLNAWTVEAVSKKAGCAKGLVNYHFKSKPKLLAATAEALEREREKRYAVAIESGVGAVALDELWEALTQEVRSGRLRAWLALRATEPLLTEPSTGALRTALASAMGAPVDAMPPDWTIRGALEGIGALLSFGAPEAELREAYDRIWLGLLPG